MFSDHPIPVSLRFPLFSYVLVNIFWNEVFTAVAHPKFLPSIILHFFWFVSFVLLFTFYFLVFGKLPFVAC